MTNHPAKFSKTLYETLIETIRGEQNVVDPFAGVSRIHEIAELAEVPNSFGIELEQEWAEQWTNTPTRQTVTGDSRDLCEILQTHNIQTQCFLTSSTYGNRMADHHIAKDKSTRNTYTHQLGHPLTEGNTGMMHFAHNGQYETTHQQIWQQCHNHLNTNGKLILNISNFLRTRKTPGPRSPLKQYETITEHLNNNKIRVLCQPTLWHTHTLQQIGFTLTNQQHTKTRRQKQGANNNIRAPHETILTFTKT